MMQLFCALNTLLTSQGMLNTVGDTVHSTAVLMSLWKHECYRVIADRFTTAEDKAWFEKAIQQTAEEDCGAALAGEMHEEPYFVDFLREAPEPTGNGGFQKC